MAVAAVIFCCVFGGALIGMAMRNLLPKHHLDNDTRDLVKLAVGLVGTMSALVLGLLVASTKASYDTHRNEVTQITATILLLDRVLAHYGPDAAPARADLRHGVAAMVDRSWAHGQAESVGPDARIGGVALFDHIEALAPHNETEHTLQSQAVSLAMSLGQTRWLLFAQQGTSIAMPFLVVVVSWLTLLSVSFGLFAPRNGTAVATLLVSALSVAAAMFLVLELDHPFSGLMQVPDAPLKEALRVLGS